MAFPPEVETAADAVPPAVMPADEEVYCLRGKI